MSRYALEALLRPPVEFYSTVTAGCGALICLTQAPWLMLTPWQARMMTSALMLLALRRGWQGWQIVRLPATGSHTLAAPGMVLPPGKTHRKTQRAYYARLCPLAQRRSLAEPGAPAAARWRQSLVAWGGTERVRRHPAAQ